MMANKLAKTIEIVVAKSTANEIKDMESEIQKMWDDKRFRRKFEKYERMKRELDRLRYMASKMFVNEHAEEQ